MNELPPIPIPMAQRWREFRLRALPLLVFCGTLIAAAWLWREQMPVAALVAEVEGTSAQVSSLKAGLLTQFNVTRLQRVKAGEVIGQVMTTDPRVLQSSLAVIQAEINLLRVNLEPVLGEQRFAMSQDRLQLDWMDQRVQLASARTRLQLAESELRRAEELAREKILSTAALDQERTKRDLLVAEIQERVRLVGDQERALETLRLRETAGTNTAPTPAAILQASIQVQEEKLHLTEAELSPISLIAPIDGVISAVHRRSGEAIAAGESLATITSVEADKIVAYIRPPVSADPRPGMTVEVLPRAARRLAVQAKVLQVGAQFEPIKAHLLPPGANRVEWGLPITVSLPPALRLHPGEPLDVRLIPQ